MFEQDSAGKTRTIGVLALQGDFSKHLAMLRQMGANTREVRVPEDLQDLDRLIIPGGESTAVGLILQESGLGEAIKDAAARGMPIWGTCMGMIIMATRVAGRPGQYTLGLLDVCVERNAFGAQVHSFEDEIHLVGHLEPVMGVFIRAPIVSELGEQVEVLARYQEKIVAVRQGRRIGTAFHPELTDDLRMHRYFFEL